MSSAAIMVKEGMFDDLSLFAGAIADLFAGADESEDPKDLQSPGPMTISPEMTATASRLKKPRFVSVSSMPKVALSSMSNASQKLTPLDSLKELVNKKQHKNVNKRRAAPASYSMMSEQTRTSEVLCQAVEKCAEPDIPVAKKVKTSFALHEACRRGPELAVADLEAFLSEDPKAASRAAKLMTGKKVYNYYTHQIESKLVAEAYQYPVNLAILYQCSPAVVERLVAAAPEVVCMEDGRSTSLHILLRHKPQDTESADMMLLKNPEMASWKDKQENTALHVALRYGVAFQTVRHLTVIDPAPLLQQNFHCQTPLDLAQRLNIVCSEEVATYLWEQVDQQF